MKTNKISQTQRPFSLSISFVSLNVLNCRPINHFIDKLPVDSSHNVISLVLLLTVFNPLTGTLKPQSNGPLYSNTVIGTLAVDGWAVTFGTARRGLDGLGPRPVPPRCTKCNSPPINGQCTNFILFDVAI